MNSLQAFAPPARHVGLVRSLVTVSLLAALLSSRGDKAIWLDARSFLRAEDGALVKVDAATLKVDQGVRVMLGKSPLPATIKEVTKDDVQVQLQTGMMLRVKFEHLVL